MITCNDNWKFQINDEPPIGLANTIRNNAGQASEIEAALMMRLKVFKEQVEARVKEMQDQMDQTILDCDSRASARITEANEIFKKGLADAANAVADAQQERIVAEAARDEAIKERDALGTTEQAKPIMMALERERLQKAHDEAKAALEAHDQEQRPGNRKKGK